MMVSSTRMSVFPVVGAVLTSVPRASLVSCKSAALSPPVSGACPAFPLLISSTPLPCSAFGLYIFSVTGAGMRGVFSVAIPSVLELVVGGDAVDVDSSVDEDSRWAPQNRVVSILGLHSNRRR